MSISEQNRMQIKLLVVMAVVSVCVGVVGTVLVAVPDHQENAKWNCTMHAQTNTTIHCGIAIDGAHRMLVWPRSSWIEAGNGVVRETLPVWRYQITSFSLEKQTHKDRRLVGIGIILMVPGFLVGISAALIAAYLCADSKRLEEY